MFLIIIGSARILQGDTENENQVKLLVEDYIKSLQDIQVCLTQATRANFRLPSFKFPKNWYYKVLLVNQVLISIFLVRDLICFQNHGKQNLYLEQQMMDISQIIMNLSHKKSPQYFCLHVLVYLKACVRYFLSNFYFFIKLQAFKNYKMFFISSKKLSLLSRYSHFCNFFPSFPHIQDFRYSCCKVFVSKRG